MGGGELAGMQMSKTKLAIDKKSELITCFFPGPVTLKKSFLTF